MSKINNLKSMAVERLLRFEDKHIENTRIDAILQKLESIKHPLVKKYYDKLRLFVDAQRKNKWVRITDALVAAKNLSGLEKLTVSTVANNTLAYLWALRGMVSPKSNPPAPEIEMEPALKTAILTAIKLWRTVGNIGSVQSMKTPTTLGCHLTVEEGATLGTFRRTLTGESEPRVSYVTKINTLALEVSSRKLHTTWTVSPFGSRFENHALDIADEISKAVSDEIANEAVRSVIHEIRNSSPTVELDFSLDSMFTAADSLGLFNRVRVLTDGIKKAAADIGTSTRRGAGNFIICSHVTVSMIQSCPETLFKLATPAEREAEGVKFVLDFVGTMGDTIKVYALLDPKDDGLIIGYRGTEVDFDAGLIYGTYLPMMPSQAVVSADSFLPTMSVFSRESQKMVDPQYFRYLKFAK